MLFNSKQQSFSTIFDWIAFDHILIFVSYFYCIMDTSDGIMIVEVDHIFISKATLQKANVRPSVQMSTTFRGKHDFLGP